MSLDTAQSLLDWYTHHGRDLPWRRTRDPYAILVSEFMLQQTRVETVLPYYERWMRRFPDFQTLSEAEPDEVMAEWEGLGYYRRARSLHRTARMVHEIYGGELPEDPDSLRELPGIGDYTAAALGAILYGRDVITLDGNLKRVLARFFGMEVDPSTSASKRMLKEKALELLPAGRASDFNQALMDIGARICLPAKPLCDLCPLGETCKARSDGSQDRIPIRRERKRIPHYRVTAGVIFRDGKVLLARRPHGKLLAGLWEFPGGKLEEGEVLEECLQRELREELGVDAGVGQKIGVYSHAYTHYRVTVTAFCCSLEYGEPQQLEHDELAWVPPDNLPDFPMGKVDRNLSADVMSLALDLARAYTDPPSGSETGTA